MKWKFANSWNNIQILRIQIQRNFSSNQVCLKFNFDFLLFLMQHFRYEKQTESIFAVSSPNKIALKGQTPAHLNQRIKNQNFA